MTTMDKSHSADIIDQQQGDQMRWKILIGSTNRPLKCRLDLRYLTKIKIAEEEGEAAINLQCPDGIASSSVVASGPSLVASSTQPQPSSQMAESGQLLASPKVSSMLPHSSQMEEFTQSDREQIKLHNQQRRYAIVDEESDSPESQCPLCGLERCNVDPMSQQIPMGQEQIPMSQQQINGQTAGGGSDINQQSPTGLSQTMQPGGIIQNPPIPGTKPDPPFMEGLTAPPKPEPPWPPRPCPANMHILQQPTPSLDTEPAQQESVSGRPPPASCRNKGPDRDKPKVCCKKKKRWCTKEDAEEDFHGDKEKDHDDTGSHRISTRRRSSATREGRHSLSPVEPLVYELPHYVVDLEKAYHRKHPDTDQRRDDQPSPPPPSPPNKPTPHRPDRKPQPDPTPQPGPPSDPRRDKSVQKVQSSHSAVRMPSRTGTPEMILDRGPFMSTKQPINYSIL